MEARTGHRTYGVEFERQGLSVTWTRIRGEKTQAGAPDTDILATDLLQADEAMKR